MIRLTFFAALVAAAVAATLSGADPKAASFCSTSSVCALPNCKCITTDIPGGFQRTEIPQMILLTFDDAVNVLNFQQYTDLIFNRYNPDGCDVKATFFVSHEYNNYTLVNTLYNRGHEIASHSITHRTNSDFWTNPEKTHWTEEMVDMRSMLEKFAEIPTGVVKGTRAPFLLMGGNDMYQAYTDNDLDWDCTWSTRNFVNPGLWPYTLDYRSYQECPIGTCPTESFPGKWVVPMVDLTDTVGNPCAMLDTCNVGTTADSVYNILKTNFDNHYNGNRSPYGLFLHAAWLNTKTNYDGYKRFLDDMANYDDVYFVTISQLLDWVKNPVGLNNLNSLWPCATIKAPCLDRRCTYVPDFTPFESERIMSVCNSVACPPFYPWYQNVYGLQPSEPFVP